MKRLTKRDGKYMDCLCENCEAKNEDFCDCGFEVWARLKQYEDMEEQGLLVRLPCKVGEPIYHIIDDCELSGGCGTKRMCKGCEYRILFIDEVVFHLCELTDSGKLRSGYYPTREEAEKALKILEEL